MAGKRGRERRAGREPDGYGQPSTQAFPAAYRFGAKFRDVTERKTIPRLLRVHRARSRELENA